MEKIFWWRTTFGSDEIAAVGQAIAAEHISQGPVTAEFESRVAISLDVPYALVTTSGSVALLMAMMALGIESGDEVIVPNRTWIATAHAAMLLGARVVLVDSLPDIPAMDVTLIREKITPRTKAIIPVHLNGRAVDMDGIRQLAEEYGLKVVEDACQALFSHNSSGLLGTQSDIGCFSLGVSKLISTGQGGIVVTRDSDLYEKLKLVRNHGVVDNFTDCWQQLGCNFKFTDILASIGIVQLGLAPERIRLIREVYARYREGLEEVSSLRLLPVREDAGELPLYVEVLCERRDDLIGFLNTKGIQARPSLPSLNTSPYLENMGEFPNSLKFAQQCMYLPCGPAQSSVNIDRIIRCVREFDRS